VPHEGEKQFQNLTMEVSCLVWAQALLDLVYDFIKEASDFKALHIPQFRFVNAAITIEQSSSTSVKKTAFLLEEVIDANTEGPFRKYLNNVSPEPLMMKTKEDERRAKFLAFSQHVQYWKTKKQVFVSDYQGKQSMISIRKLIDAYINTGIRWQYATERSSNFIGRVSLLNVQVSFKLIPGPLIHN
jgi:hypothetical protein